MHNVLNPGDDVDKLHVPRKESEEDFEESKIVLMYRLEDYIKIVKAAVNNTIWSNNVKARIDKMQQNSKCR